MRRLPNLYRLPALVGLLSLVAWGCSTDSPTAPRQVNPPTPTPGATYTISLGADPSGIAVAQEGGTGFERTTLVVEVSNPRPADGTLIELTTTLGSLTDPVLGVTTRGGVELVNGRAFFTLFAGLPPIQLGIASVRANLGSSIGEVQIPIAFLLADFECSNPDLNVSVAFSNTSSANADSFHWDFGDGTTSDERSPHHVFPADGTYSVQLTARSTILQVILETSTTKVVSTAADGCGGA